MPRILHATYDTAGPLDRRQPAPHRHQARASRMEQAPDAAEGGAAALRAKLLAVTGGAGGEGSSLV